MCLAAYNRAYLASLRSAQIPLLGTSDTLETLTKKAKVDCLMIKTLFASLQHLVNLSLLSLVKGDKKETLSGYERSFSVNQTFKTSSNSMAEYLSPPFFKR